MKQIQYINDETLKDYIDTADTQSYWRESRIYQIASLLARSESDRTSLENYSQGEYSQRILFSAIKAQGDC